MLPDITAGIIDITAQNLAELVHPFLSLRPVGSDQRMHGQHVLTVVMAQSTLLPEPVPEILIVDYMVGAHQPGQVKGFRRSVNRNGTVPGILRHGLCGQMTAAV